MPFSMNLLTDYLSKGLGKGVSSGFHFFLKKAIQYFNFIIKGNGSY